LGCLLAVGGSGAWMMRYESIPWVWTLLFCELDRISLLNRPFNKLLKSIFPNPTIAPSTLSPKLAIFPTPKDAKRYEQSTMRAESFAVSSVPPTGGNPFKPIQPLFRW